LYIFVDRIVSGTFETRAGRNVVRARLGQRLPPFPASRQKGSQTMHHVSASPRFHPAVTICIIHITLMEGKNIIDSLLLIRCFFIDTLLLRIVTNCLVVAIHQN
jgi:hypothetical protein